MPQYYYNKSGQIISISEKPVATPGGEGAIFDVLSSPNKSNSRLVAKIYHTSQIAKARQTKIEFMVKNSPTKNSEKAIKEAIVWPVETLYDVKNNFVGFTMPKISNAITLKSLTLPSNPSKKHGRIWQKFDHNQSGSHQKRLVVAYNLVQAIDTIHKRGNYVLVDLKPENVFIKPNGSIAIIDLDSLQINNPNTQFPAKVYTEEFAPPELHKGLTHPKSGTIEKSWDYFSLAVILYELFFGIHPFQASHSQFTTRPELIKNNLFVHGKRKKELHVIPKLHQNIERVDKTLKKMFFQTFDIPISKAFKRVTTQQWTETILPLINLKDTIATQLDYIPTKAIQPVRQKSYREKIDITKPKTKVKTPKKKPVTQTPPPPNRDILTTVVFMSSFAGFGFIALYVEALYKFVIQNWNESTPIGLILGFVLVGFVFYKLGIDKNLRATRRKSFKTIVLNVFLLFSFAGVLFYSFMLLRMIFFSDSFVTPWDHILIPVCGIVLAKLILSKLSLSITKKLHNGAIASIKFWICVLSFVSIFFIAPFLSDKLNIATELSFILTILFVTVLTIILFNPNNGKWKQVGNFFLHGIPAFFSAIYMRNVWELHIVYCVLGFAFVLLFSMLLYLVLVKKYRP